MSGTEVDREIAVFISAGETQKQCLLRLFDGQAHKAKNCDNFPQFCQEYLGVVHEHKYVYALLAGARVERRLLPFMEPKHAGVLTLERLKMFAKLNDYPTHQERAFRQFIEIRDRADSGMDKHHDMSLKRLVEQQLAQIEEEIHKRNSVDVESYDPKDKQKRQVVGGTSKPKESGATLSTTGNEVVEVKPDAPAQTQTPADTAQQASSPDLPEFSPIAGNEHHGLLETNAPDEEDDEPDDMADAPFDEETADYDLPDIQDAFQTALTWLENGAIVADRQTRAWFNNAMARFADWQRTQGD